MATLETSIVGFVAAALTSTGLAPQVIRAFRTHEVDDLSPMMMVVLGGGMALWIVYGFAIGDAIVIGANIVGSAFAFALFLLWARHRTVTTE